MTVVTAPFVLPAAVQTASAVPLEELDPASIPKYIDPLVIPPPMPPSPKLPGMPVDMDYYEIAVRQFTQQILPAVDAAGVPTGLPPTTVWSYGSVTSPVNTFNYPAFTVEAKANRPVRVKWINDLVDASGNYLPHLLPVDQTLHWANPPGGMMHRDHHGTDPTPYTGPVPIVTHVHGAHVADHSDGYAEAWYLPAANNIPAGYATTGTFYDYFKTTSPLGAQWGPGFCIFEYPNDQAASTLWYHDHTLGMTRLNVYAGPAGFWIVRGGMSDINNNSLPGPAPRFNDKPGTKYYEIPIAIQDRSFYADGSLFFPDYRAYFEGLSKDQLQIPFIPDMACDGKMSDVSPIWNPEFFGNTIVVNGKTWPKLQVEPRRYRFRFLNGCNSRFLVLKMVTDPLAARPAVAALPFWQVGAEGGFLPAPVQLDQLLIALAERADVVVDFTGLAVGTKIYLINEGPDSPFGGLPIAPEDLADPDTTGQVMLFEVVPLASKDKSAPPAQLKIPKMPVQPAPVVTRQVSLNEVDSDTVRVSEDGMGNIVLDCENGEPFGPKAALQGTVTFDPVTGMPMGMPMPWMDPITENPAVGATEVWEIYNFTMDAHPIHLHLVTFKVVNRESLMMPGMVTLPEPWETGYKDTVIAYPDQITRVQATFDLPGLYVWHCHIVDHEDNEMMRPYHVGPIPAGMPLPQPMPMP